MGTSDHGKGFLLTFLGVMVLTPDTLLIRLVGLDQWSVVFWRGLLMGSTLMVTLALIYRQRLFGAIRETGRYGLMISASYTLSSMGFVLSVSHTSVANTLVIVATSPMFAALLSIVLLKEKINLATWVAIGLSFIGILVVVGDSFGSGDYAGNLFALMTAVSMAFGFTMIRRKPNTDMVPSLAVAGLAAAAITFPLTGAFDYSQDQMQWIAVMGVVVLPISFGLLTIGPRFIPAPEVSLLMLLETTLGPLWVWLVIGEEPSRNALIGGGIVVGTLVIHSLRRLMRARKRKNALA
ncbi:DMT family transporter [Aestuariispira ectoiniformans]|uniref:DMT family transporter n=1 Tax=Aestuariispira ectoiniformans TaxID=2775080 RepID=UPI00223BFE0D|nr:DMT family transporter [Aestuariispira ectoiniformans]